ncbi:MAG: aldehyde dehydrogenase family protein [Xanthomonadales bacterium]|nr:aldehyde dehydrogenase family protein [Xanthomonadales bacterium]
MTKTTAKTGRAAPAPSAAPGLVVDYAPSIESDKIVTIPPRHQLYIGGEWVKPAAGRYFASVNPATLAPLSEVAEAGAEDVDAAVRAAKRAYDRTWSKLSGRERGRYLFRIARLIQERARELAVLETLDNGKPIRETRDVDIPLVAAHFFYYAGWADKLGYALPGAKLAPLGVAGQIIPWNFPLWMAAWKIAPALACGNTVVLKPAEQTPLTALKLVEIFEAAGLPPGVVNIVTGAGATGAALTTHPLVRKIAFTGSTEVGKSIGRAVAGSGKKLTLELGGKSAHLIFADAAIDQAVEGVVNGIFFNQGHVCCAGSRLLVEEPVADLVLAKLKARMQKLRVGNPLDKNTDIGAINSTAEIEKIRRLIETGKQEGARYYEPENIALPSKGNFLRPCLFSDVASSHTICRVEVFGPVLAVSTFRTPAEAIAKANDTPYGLAAGIWSEKGSKVHAVAAQLRAGVIWANTYNKFDPTSPFGGYGESGYGREGGRHGLLPYLEVVP